MPWFKAINKKELLKFGIGGGLAEVIYIILVALLMYKTGELGNQSGSPYLGISMLLLLFVFSAAVSGLFVLGYPAILALQHKYKEAILTLALSLVTIFLAFIIALTIVMLR
jgi:hypothetical protein